MPRRIDDITEENIQRHVIQFEQDEIVLTIRFYPFSEFWAFDVEFRGKVTYGVKITCGSLHIRSRNYPFDFVCQDESGEGLDPFRIADFAERRCTLYILDADDMEAIRGTAVQI